MRDTGESSILDCLAFHFSLLGVLYSMSLGGLLVWMGGAPGVWVKSRFSIYDIPEDIYCMSNLVFGYRSQPVSEKTAQKGQIYLL